MTDRVTYDLTPKQTPRVLRRILDAVERAQRNRWVEVACATVLALATTASAWSAYQSNLWSAVQAFKLAAAAGAGRDAGKHEMEAMNGRLFDAVMLIHFVERRAAGEEKTVEFLHRRFRPEVKAAVDAWLATDPFERPDAPASPFLMPEYVQADRVEAERLHAEEARMHEAARRASQVAHRYVLLTVLFAAVLFFGGISGTLGSDSRLLRWAMQVMALLLFLSVSAYLFTMPLCRE